MERFRDKVCVITASATGIGFAIARRFGQEGGKIVVSSRNQAHIDQAVQILRAEGITAQGVVCHVSKDRKKLVDFAVQKFGGIDVLVNNAAASLHVGEVLDIDEVAYDKMFDVNVKSAFFLTKEAFPYLKKSGKGRVLNVCSQTSYRPEPMIGVYSTTKTALAGLTKVLALQLMKYGIRVTGIAPSVIDTKFAQVIVDSGEGGKNAVERPGRPEECAALAAFLCSDEASFLVGEVVVADGGQLTRL